MNKTLRNILAVLAGIVIGSVVNMALVKLGPSIIPVPEGVDVTDPESLKEGIHLFETRHFIFPFLAHAIGTLVGAFITALIAASHRMAFAIAIGGFFLLGGIMNLFMLPSPTWFAIVDLVVAYFPMAWIGGKIAISLVK